MQTATDPCRRDEFTLPNGMRVIAEQMPGLRTICAGVWVRCGSILELPEENGLSHFLEHMVFKGTETRSSRQISEEVDALGGQLDAFTSKDHTCYYTKMIDEDLPMAIDILSDLVCHAALDEAELEREKGVILEEIAMDEDTPEEVAQDLLARAQYEGTPAAMPILGPAEQVRAYTRHDLAAFRAKHYRPESTVLCVVGHYDANELKELAERYFGSWQNPAVEAVMPLLDPLTGRRLVREKDTEQLHICLGWPGCRFGEKPVVAQAVTNLVLGSSMSSRLFQRIREELGMAYTVYSYTQGYRSAGMFGIYAGVSPQNGPTVLEEIRKVVDTFVKEGPTEREFSAARTQMRAGHLMSLESPSSRMQSMGRSLLLRGFAPSYEERLRQMESVTVEDVMDFARRVLTLEPCLGAAGKGAEQL